MPGRASRTLFTLTGEGDSGFDDSVCEYAWSEIPLSDFVIRDGATEEPFKNAYTLTQKWDGEHREIPHRIDT